MSRAYVEYYKQQAGGGIPVFAGVPFQRGRGFGNVFKSLFRFITPVVRAIIPVAKRAAPVLGKEMLHASSGILQDLASGSNFKDAAKERLKTAGENLTHAALEQLQKGSGKKRKKAFKAVKRSKTGHSKKRRRKRSKVDIFS